MPAMEWNAVMRFCGFRQSLAGLAAALVLLGWGGGAGAQVILDQFARPVAWQLALEKACFSPGLIDGKPGAKTELATREYQKSFGLPVTGTLDDATTDSLGLTAISSFGQYTVEAQDIADLMPESHDWLEKSKRLKMGYFSQLDALAEKFHTSKGFLGALNSGVAWESLKGGEVLVVPFLQEPTRPAARALRVNLDQKVIYLLDEHGKVVGLFHCSIAAKFEKRPSGEGRVEVVAPNPNYTWDPAYWPEVKGIEQKLLIPPGPRNPVGLFWVGLNLPGYGMHGTPTPEMIGKSGSHGCFRLTNWDAMRLGKIAKVGMKVEFVNSGRPTTSNGVPASAGRR